MDRSYQRAAAVALSVATALMGACDSKASMPAEPEPITSDMALAADWALAVDALEAATLSAAVADMAERILPTLPRTSETAQLTAALADLQAALARPGAVPGPVVARVVDALRANGAESGETIVELDVARLAMERALDLSQARDARSSITLRERLYAVTPTKTAF